MTQKRRRQRLEKYYRTFDTSFFFIDRSAHSGLYNVQCVAGAAKGQRRDRWLCAQHPALCVLRCACAGLQGETRGAAGSAAGSALEGNLLRSSFEMCSRPRRTCARENLKCRLHLKEYYLTFLLSSKPLSIIPLNADLNSKFFIWPSLIFYEKLLS